MLYGIIADIHSNLEAFEVVLRELRDVNRLICLGDIVGYGPNPNECNGLIKEKKISTVAGNHDKAAVREMNTEWFNESARRAIEWTEERLTESGREYLKSLTLTLEFPDFQIVHGSLREPLEEYVTTLGEAAASMEMSKKPLLFVGHTHVPMCVVMSKESKFDGWVLKDNQSIKISDYHKVLINPGGVGQPRDGDPRASFGVYDSDKKEFRLRRIEYNIPAVQEKMVAAGLPQSLIDRLKFGR